jgi:hypothetical protein
MNKYERSAYFEGLTDEDIKAQLEELKAESDERSRIHDYENGIN